MSSPRLQCARAARKPRPKPRREVRVRGPAPRSARRATSGLLHEAEGAARGPRRRTSSRAACSADPGPPRSMHHPMISTRRATTCWAPVRADQHRPALVQRQAEEPTPGQARQASVATHARRQAAKKTDANNHPRSTPRGHSPRATANCWPARSPGRRREGSELPTTSPRISGVRDETPTLDIGRHSGGSAAIPALTESGSPAADDKARQQVAERVDPDAELGAPGSSPRPGNAWPECRFDQHLSPKSKCRMGPMPYSRPG